MYHSQNNEAQIIIEYFHGFVGGLLSIGENDGQTFSNSYDLIKRGWQGVLVEPSLAYWKLKELYEGNRNVETFNCAIGTKSGMQKFQEGSDSLLSGINKGNAQSYIERDVMFWAFEDFSKNIGLLNADFLTIDCEGMDIDILRQIDLNKYGCKCLCIEHNNRDNEIIEYCREYKLYPIHRNGENLILAV